MLRHTIRTASGWRPNSSPLKSTQRTGTLTAVSAAGVAGELHLVAVVGGRLWQSAAERVRSWSEWTKSHTVGGGKFPRGRAPASGDSLHVVALGAKGESSNLWYTIRKVERVSEESDGQRP